MDDENEPPLIELLDLQTLQRETFTIQDILPNMDLHQQYFNNFSHVYGAEVHVRCKFSNVETLIREFFSDKGYDVIRTTSFGGTSLEYNLTKRNEKTGGLGGFNGDKFRECFKHKYEHDLDDVVKAGIPDFLMVKRNYRGDEFLEIFFVEVKSETDNLRTTQLKWMFEYNINVKVAIINNNSVLETTIMGEDISNTPTP